MEKKYKSVLEAAIVSKLKTGRKNPNWSVNPPPKSIAEQNKLADEMLQWSYSKEACLIEEFPLSKKMSPTFFYRIAINNEYFSHALDIAKHNLGARIMHSWRNKKLDREYALKMYPMYNKKYAQKEREKIASLNSAIENATRAKNETFKIVKQDFIVEKKDD